MEGMTHIRTEKYRDDVWYIFRVERTDGTVWIRNRNAKVSPPRTSKSETQPINRKQGKAGTQSR